MINYVCQGFTEIAKGIKWFIMGDDMARTGRPRKFTKEYIEAFRFIFPDNTERTIINAHYQSITLQALDKADFDYTFLVDRKKQTIKQSLMVELGRLENDQDILTVARRVCELATTEKYNIKGWVKIIRYMRLNRCLV